VNQVSKLARVTKKKLTAVTLGAWGHWGDIGMGQQKLDTALMAYSHAIAFHKYNYEALHGDFVIPQ
jgi:hypothetical protein